MIASIDVGLKRIGLALAFGSVVIPQNAIIRKNRKQASSEVGQFLRQNNIKTLVVGLPKGGSSEDEMKRRITHFISLVDFDGEIKYIDESYSSVEASELKAFSSKKKDGKLDSLAAMIILQRYIISVQV
ncbi:MAG: Holliday junction resolvase RuvX [Campylobacter sp.]|nr:Holliday junction resolvase RuvX [Campylobacter sp.]